MFYDNNRSTAVSADTSNFVLGSVLLQFHVEEWKPAAYCSRRLTEAKPDTFRSKRSLWQSFGPVRSSKYLYGLEDFKLVTDYKYLVPLMNSKDLDNVPLRCHYSCGR